MTTDKVRKQLMKQARGTHSDYHNQYRVEKTVSMGELKIVFSALELSRGSYCEWPEENAPEGKLYLDFSLQGGPWTSYQEIEECLEDAELRAYSLLALEAEGQRIIEEEK